MLRHPLTAVPVGVIAAAAGREGDTRQQLAARTAKLAASAPITQAGPAKAVRPLARAGPTTIAADVNVDTSALAVTRSSSGSDSAISVYAPALPQACSSDEAASNAT
jgi:hypothetical protein